ncbi:MAG TPA: helix-turn-helix transcriptional regulator [Gemmatimonadales bacterium]|nr:helix-turn-helix transcriptional regulator [Gemmatimonadales bacterium]
MAPLDWGDRDAWLAESLRRVRAACGAAGPDPAADPVTELEGLLRLPDEEPGWLARALADGEHRGRILPAGGAGSEAFMRVVSMRCALLAGLEALHRLERWRGTLGQAFDDVETGMAIFGDGGLVEVARNARMVELLDEEPARERLRELIAHQARRAAVWAESPRDEAREEELRGGFYRLTASRMVAGTVLSEPAVLVLVDRVRPSLPTTQELRATFGLRGREPQIALLAAKGLSNAAIAERLRLSAHTVRHYLERVLGRLGLHTRKALALHLMAGGDRSESPGRE